MASLISIRLSDELLQDLKNKASTLHLSQTDYIRQAIQLMNDKTEQRQRKRRLKQASLCVREESMSVNAEFGEIDDDTTT